MFGTYDFDNHKFVLREVVKKALISSIRQHCIDMAVTPEDITEEGFKSYLYDLVNYSDDFYEEIADIVGCSISYS